jgi:outer membrane protein TolC
MVTWFPSPIETRLGPQDWNASLSQTIPFPGKLTTSGEVVKTDADMAKVATDARVREVIARVTQSFHELTYIRKARQIAKENAILLDKLRQMAETGHARERTALIDVVKAQAQVGQLRYDILLLEELEQTESTLLNSLLNRPPDGTLGILQPQPVTLVDISINTLYTLADANQEGIRIAGLRVEKAKHGVTLSQYAGKPDFKLGLFYAAIGNPDVPFPPRDAGNDAVGIQFGVNIPLWFGKNNGNIDMARAVVLQEKAMLTEIKNQTHSRIRSLYFKLNNSKRLMILYGKELMPQAVKALDVSQEWFRNGQGSFSDVLEAQAAVYNFQLALARARADYGKTLAELQRLVGVRIDQWSGASRTREVDNG